MPKKQTSSNKLPPTEKICDTVVASASTTAVYSPLNDMASLAKNQLCDANVIGLKGSEVSNQAKLFLVSQARHELQRIMKCTQFLDDLENKFMKSVDVALLDRPYDMNTITTAMDIISRSLERSNKLVTQILEDENINTLVVNTTVISNNNTNMVNIASGGALDSTSRDQIRQLASNLLQQLQNPEDAVETTAITDDASTLTTK